MSKSAIEWTDETWNPVTGCTKVSAGCKHCYAEREWPRMTRLVPAYAGRAFADVRCHPERLEQPLRWKRPRKVFVNSMSDLFHPDVPDWFIDSVFAVMSIAESHTFQILTKRPHLMRTYLSDPNRVGKIMVAATALNGDIDPSAICAVWPLPNVWLGVSVENQEAADERIPLLLQTPAAVRFISAEPLLGAVDLNRLMYSPKHSDWTYRWEGLTGFRAHKCGGSENNPRLDWIIVGGESGPSARPMSPDWVRSLRDQCAAAGVPFLFKQWGEWREPLDSEYFDTSMGRAQRTPAFIVATDGSVHCFENYQTTCSGRAMLRVGKKAAGRLLDGVLHDGYPVPLGGEA